MSRSQINRAALIALTVIAIALLGTLVYPFTSALVFAAVLACAFQPWLERLSARLGGRRVVAGTLITLGTALLIVLPIALLTMAVGRQVVEGVAYVHDTVRRGGMPALIDDLPPLLREPVDGLLEQLPHGQAQIEELAGNQTTKAAAAVGGILKAMSSVFFQTAMMLVAFFFLLVDGPQLVDWLASVAPLRDGQMREILSDFRNVSVAVLVSSAATAGAQSAAALAGYLIAGVPQPLFFMAATFVAAFIPVLGATSVSLALAALLLVTGRTEAALFLAAWSVLVVAFVDNLVKPLLLKGRMEVHGAAIFFALLGGMAVFGPVGLLAGPLILAFFLAVVRLCQRDLRLTS